MVKGTEHGRVKWCEKTMRERKRESTKMTIISVPLKQRWERFWVCQSGWLVWDQVSTSTTPTPQSKATSAFYWFTQQTNFCKRKIEWGVCMEPAQTAGPTWLDLKWGPKERERVVWVKKSRWEPSTHWEERRKRKEGEEGRITSIKS